MQQSEEAIFPTPEPAIRMQRSAGHGALYARAARGGTVARRIFQEGSAKIRRPDPHGNGWLEAVLINTSGGMTGGDRFRWEVAAAEGARVTATTPAYEKIYRSSGGVAKADVRLSAGRGAQLRWLPQETLLFDGAAFERTVEADLEGNASLLMAEAVLLGRLARGERVRHGHFRDRWRIRRDGRLVHAEETGLSGDLAAAAGPAAALDAGAAFATVVLVADGARDLVGVARAALEGKGGESVSAGVSGWSVGPDAKLVARLRAADGYALRSALTPLLEALCAATGPSASLPKLWEI